MPPPLYPPQDQPYPQSSGYQASGDRFPGYPAPGSKPQNQPQEFFGWIRSHGIQRGRDRWIGGVSSGIAHRMGVDPLIVRGIFIVLTLFAGIGVLLYGLGWALLPEPDGRIHAQEAGAGRWSTGMTGALITSVIGLTGLGGGVWGWGRGGFAGFFWTVFWVGGLIYLAYFLTQRNKNRNGAAPMSARPPSGSNAAFAATAPLTDYDGGAHNGGYAAYGSYAADTYTPGAHPSSGADAASGSARQSGPYPPFSGGSGNVPPRGPARIPKIRPGGPGAPAVAVATGAALLAGGGIKALDAGNVIDLGNSVNAIVWASGAAVLGLGILIAGIKGRTSGILGFFAVVALIIGGIFNVVPTGDRFRVQAVDWNPVTVQQARDGFDATGSNGTVNLTKLDLGAPLGSDVVIPLDITASNVTVIIPDTVPVEIRADMTLGNLNEGGERRGGTTTRQSSYNTEKPGAKLIVRIDGTFSNITIQEGN